MYGILIIILLTSNSVFFRYESKGKQWAKNKPTLPVGLDPSYAVSANNTKSAKTIPGLSLTNDETAAPSKSSKKKKKKKSDSPKVVDDVANNIEKMNISASDKSTTNFSETPSSQKSQPITTDPAKRLRNLRKKIRDINALKQKIESGELPNPDKDQLEKIARKEAIEAEIEELELELDIV